MDLYRRLGDVARAGNHLVGMTFHKTIEDLNFTPRQFGEPLQQEHALRAIIAHLKTGWAGGPSRRRHGDRCGFGLVTGSLAALSRKLWPIQLFGLRRMDGRR